MAKNYNVDDILEEVRRKRQAEQPPAARPAASPERAAPRRAAPRDEAPAAPRKEAPPFRLTGLTDEFERVSPAREEPSAPPPRREPERRAAEPARRPPLLEDTGEFALPTARPTRRGDETRLDLPIAKPTDGADDLGATRVMPAVRGGDRDLENRRQQKVREFMKSSFASLEEDDQPDAEAAPARKPSERDTSELGSLASFFGGLNRSPSAHGGPRGLSDSGLRQQKSGGAAALPEYDEPLEGEYAAQKDAPAVARDIAAIQKGLTRRLVLSTVCFVALLYLALCNLFKLPLLYLIAPEYQAVAGAGVSWTYLAASLGVMLIAALISNSVVGSGLLSLVTLKADQDTPAALATLAVVAQGVAALVTALAGGSFLQLGDASFYFPVAALALVFNALGKLMMIRRVGQNFAVAAAADEGLVGEYLLTGDALAHELTEGQDLDEPALAYPLRAAFPESFLKLSYTDDYAEGLSRLIAPLFLLFGIALGLVSWLVFKQPPTTALTVFTAVLCMASPLTATLTGNIPLYRAAARLSGKGAFIAGYDSVEQFSEANGVIVTARELYPAGSVVLHGIKSLAQSRIDEAILDAASVMSQVDGLLKEIFLEMIGHKVGILKRVDALSYEDGMGLCAEVDGKPVFIGNRALMKRHGIELPSREYEQKFIKDDRQLLYLANSGEVTALFVLSYQANAEVAAWLDELAHQGMSLAVDTSDPNITEKKLAEDFNYPEEYIKVMPAESQRKFSRLTRPVERGRAYAMSTPEAAPGVRLRLLAALGGLRRSILLGTVLQLVGLVLGYALIAFLAFTGLINAMGFVQLMLYQVVWALIVSGIPCLQRL